MNKLKKNIQFEMRNNISTKNIVNRKEVCDFYNWSKKKLRLTSSSSSPSSDWLMPSGLSLFLKASGSSVLASCKNRASLTMPVKLESCGFLVFLNFKKAKQTKSNQFESELTQMCKYFILEV